MGGRLVTHWAFILASVAFGAEGKMAPGIADDGNDVSPPSGSADVLKSIETEHFVVRYDTDVEVVTSLAGTFESTFDDVITFCRELDLEIRLPLKRLRVVLFSTPETLRAYCMSLGIDSPGTTGLYNPERNLTLLSNIASQADVLRLTERIEALSDAAISDRATRPLLSDLRQRRRALVNTFNRLVIRHELAHHVLFNVGVHRRDGLNPDWLVEGLACAFEEPSGSTSPGSSRPALSMNRLRLDDLRLALRFDPSVSTEKERRGRFAEAVQAGRLVSLGELVGGGDALDASGQHAATRYAQAWSLVHFLRSHHSQAFGRYIRQKGRDGATQPIDFQSARMNFEAMFGPLDARFVGAWLDCVDEAFLSE